MSGDVVYIQLPAPAGRRPAVVVQNDRDNLRMSNTIVVQATSNLRRVAEQTQLLIDPSHPDWSRSGLKMPSVVNCSNLATIPHANILKVFGNLSSETMNQVSEGLRTALEL